MDDVRVLEAWEAGCPRNAATRPLVVLAAAYPERSREALAALPVGRRNALLLEDRRRTVGPRLDAEADCPACAERLDVTIDVTQLVDQAPDGASEGSLSVEGLELRFRLPTMLDLEVAAGCADAEEARRLLLARCVLAATREGAAVAPEDLPSVVVDALDAEFARRDPHAVLSVAIVCAACGAATELALDPGSLYWTELEQRARRLLLEVHRMATAYGWTEREILSLSPQRRAAYLELVA